MFDNLSTAPPPPPIMQDELAHYLGSPTEATSDPIGWWLKNRKAYPCLSHMVLYYLSIPGEFVLPL